MPFLEGHTPASCLNSYIPYSNKILRHKTHCMWVCPSCRHYFSATAIWLVQAAHTKNAHRGLLLLVACFLPLWGPHTLYIALKHAARNFYYMDHASCELLQLIRERHGAKLSLYFSAKWLIFQTTSTPALAPQQCKHPFGPTFCVSLQNKMAEKVAENYSQKNIYIHERKLYEELKFVS